MCKATLANIKSYFTILTLIYVAMLLVSCSHAHRDGPPNYYVDETKIPNATPKPEHLAKYGNMPSYVVFGKRYYTLRSASNYSEVGIASWYGTQFHELKTSSGEPYNMLGMTAAHKSLPLPTYVEVTNLRNHRKIIVKVNDRGPFEANRIIDLSYVAAKKLDMLKHGTAPVRIRAINPYTFGPQMELAQNTHPALKSPQSKIINHPSAIYLQAGAFKNRTNAAHFKAHLEAIISAPTQITSPLLAGSFYKVQIGPIYNLEAANHIISQLKNIGITPTRL